MHFKVPIIVLLAMSTLTLGSLSYIRAGSKPAVPTSEGTRRTPVLVE
jgi:hypothetical protein